MRIDARCHNRRPKVSTTQRILLLLALIAPAQVNAADAPRRQR
jgi:hypothetical protein